MLFGVDRDFHERKDQFSKCPIQHLVNQLYIYKKKVSIDLNSELQINMPGLSIGCCCNTVTLLFVLSTAVELTV